MFAIASAVLAVLVRKQVEAKGLSCPRRADMGYTRTKRDRKDASRIGRARIRSSFERQLVRGHANKDDISDVDSEVKEACHRSSGMMKPSEMVCYREMKEIRPEHL